MSLSGEAPTPLERHLSHPIRSPIADRRTHTDAMIMANPDRKIVSAGPASPGIAGHRQHRALVNKSSAFGPEERRPLWRCAARRGGGGQGSRGGTFVLPYTVTNYRECRPPTGTITRSNNVWPLFVRAALVDVVVGPVRARCGDDAGT